MKSIAVIGGSGYIGKHLLQSLASGYHVTSLQRNIHAIMPEQEGISIASTSEQNRTFDIIINTSYNLGKDIDQVYAQNEEVLTVIQKAAHAQTHIIHLSSLAVFGFGLDRPIAAEPVSLENDYAYVQSKVHMEQLLLQSFSPEQLSIIRLGNVWGPANNSWTQPVAEALQWELPVLSPSSCFSNITFIHHITHYISYVITHAEHQLFHHLAEFSYISWQHIIHEMSNCLGAKPVPIKDIPFYATSMGDDLNHAAQHGLIGLLKHLREGRFTSHYFPRVFFSKLLAFIHTIKPKTPGIRQTGYHADPTFYWILTCRREFKTAVLPGWVPPFTWEEVSRDVCSWMNEAGYLIEKIPSRNDSL